MYIYRERRQRFLVSLCCPDRPYTSGLKQSCFCLCFLRSGTGQDSYWIFPFIQYSLQLFNPLFFTATTYLPKSSVFFFLSLYTHMLSASHSPLRYHSCLWCSWADALGKRKHHTYAAQKDFRSKQGVGATKTPHTITPGDSHVFADE